MHHSQCPLDLIVRIRVVPVVWSVSSLPLFYMQLVSRCESVVIVELQKENSNIDFGCLANLSHIRCLDWDPPTNLFLLY